MRTSDFDYNLPSELIAQKPTEKRSDSRLLHLDRDESKSIQHLKFIDILSLLEPRDLLVFNDTKVIPARLYGRKDTGGKVEVLIESITDENHCLAHVRASKSPKPGSSIKITQDLGFKVLGRQDELFILETVDASLDTLMAEAGHMPLPPYIERDDDDFDVERYQTVYAKSPGAVAAPTAGLHFDEKLLEKIKDKGVKSVFVTLHVGAGTFQPVRAEYIRDHKMHKETISVSESVVHECKNTRESGGRIIAVGTTAVRSLEAASQTGEIRAFQGETDIFITPGYTFRTVDALITNFHLPQSTLLMLVSAFAGRTRVMQAYEDAITQKYRFFSYGDAMFLS